MRTMLAMVMVMMGLVTLAACDVDDPNAAHDDVAESVSAVESAPAPGDDDLYPTRQLCLFDCQEQLDSDMEICHFLADPDPNHTDGADFWQCWHDAMRMFDNCKLSCVANSPGGGGSHGGGGVCLPGLPGCDPS